MLVPPAETYVSDEIGDSQDRVTIQLGSDQLLIAEAWNIESAILSQPAKWSVRIGWGQDVATGMFWRYPERTPFRLSIHGAPQSSGYIDTRRLEGSGDGSTLVVSGRDALAPLYDAYVDADQAFPDATYSSIVRKVLEKVGLDPDLLVLNNAANRRLTAGVSVEEIAPSDTVDQLKQSVPGTLGVVGQKVQAKFGQRWLEFLRKHLDRAGLMIWAGGDGKIILSTPNGAQKPSYSLFRNLTQTAGQTNILQWSIEASAMNRHSEVIFTGRGGGRKAGRAKAKGLYVDAEMQGYGYDQPFAHRDSYVQTGAQAAYFARRKLVEERRDGWRLEYVFAGHTLPFYGATGSSAQRAVVVPDTVVSVVDALAGIRGNFYIETVRRERLPGGTVTTIRLIRPEDLVFGDISTPAAPVPAVSKKPTTGTNAMFDVLRDGGVNADGTTIEDPWASGSSTGGTP